MNPDILNKSIEPVENPGLETTDPRLGEIGAFVQKAEYSEAGALAQSIFEEDIYDVRIVGYYLYGLFEDQGLIALSGINNTLIQILQENWDAFGPSRKKEKHAQISLNWFIKQLVKTLTYEEQKDGNNWKKWLAEIASDDVDVIIESLDTLLKELLRVLEDNASALQEGLLNIKNWLTNFQRLVYVEPEPESGGDEPEGDEPTEKAQDEAKTESPAQPRVVSESPVSGLTGSWHLKTLLNKLEAFEYLAGQGKFEMAALVADDINTIISDFDPTQYFPELFSGFSLTYAKNITEIISCENYKGSPNWKAMMELYKVDLDSFLSFDPGDLPVQQINVNNQTDDEYENHQDDEY